MNTFEATITILVFVAFCIIGLAGLRQTRTEKESIEDLFFPEDKVTLISDLNMVEEAIEQAEQDLRDNTTDLRLARENNYSDDCKKALIVDRECILRNLSAWRDKRDIILIKRYLLSCKKGDI